jgi:hypothetical protein
MVKFPNAWKNIVFDAGNLKKKNNVDCIGNKKINISYVNGICLVR